MEGKAQPAPTALTLEFKLVVLSLLAVVVSFGALLYFFPTQSAVYWAWVIADPRSAILVGSPYLAATLYYVLVLVQNDWIQAQNGLGGLILFALALLVATMVSWDSFRPYHITTILWLILYYAGPLLFPILYYKYSRAAGEVAESGPMLSPAVRAWMGFRGVVYLALAVLGLALAPAVSNAWPWAVGDLNVRVFMGQLLVVGWHGLMLVRFAPSWRRHRLGLVLVGGIGAVQLIGLLIGSTPYNWAAPLGIVLPVMLAEWLLTPLVIGVRYGRKPA